jgi:hypothetical protein
MRISEHHGIGVQSCFAVVVNAGVISFDGVIKLALCLPYTKVNSNLKKHYRSHFLSCASTLSLSDSSFHDVVEASASQTPKALSR